MNKIDFKIATLFAPLAYAIHHFEEHIIFNFRAWRLLYFKDNNPLSTETVFLILSAITLIYILLHFIYENKATAQSLIIFLMSTQVVNFIFHAGGTVVFWDFSPGLITAILLYVPVNLLILSKALEENWVNKQTILILCAIGATLFTLFELFGPFPMITFLIATYVWIIYTIRQAKLSRV
jgi:hypothetical protein